MATVIGDFASDPSRFRHNMVFQSQHPPQPSHHPQSLRSSSRPRDAPSSSYRHQQQPPPSSSSPPSSTSLRHPDHDPSYPQRAAPTTDQPRPTAGWADTKHKRGQDGASRFPTPPDSSSPSASNSASARPQDAAAATVVPSAHMDTSDHHNGVATPFSSSTAVASSASTVVQGKSPTAVPERPSAANSIPSPASDSFPPWAAPDSPLTRPVQNDAQTQQTTIRVHDLAHIQSLARADLVTGNGPGLLNDPPLSQMKYDISEMPIGDIIEMVAALLTKITTTNDLQHDALNRNATHQRQAQQAQQHSESGSGEGSSGGGAAGAGAGSPYANSVLAFHGKNVPAITILSYLSRIHKYCPTTFEVFLSLLAYFDRMTERVNELVAKSEEEKQGRSQYGEKSKKRQRDGEDVVMGGNDDEADHGGDGAGANDGDETDEDLADSSDEGDGDNDSVRGGRKRARGNGSGKPAASSKEAALLASSTATYFVVDSYNIHRLIIAGVTCASKFFSDVFYTNSRYAKVGGLPLAELNHLELQFLLLNDFRLAVPVEDLEAYATMLVEFYAREVVGQRSRPANGPAE
ncbi:hypothetical protein MAPG_10129 [Magnaporthiopsis poae ATCC 64411]|uniref:PHO85 cyclin-6 n=1 Tax=Magnaporthiopsis poae (strain ATCC 64411 / 73-15) TaxID=644358 RepID=A0A0C4EBS4_MAGP6|nr:hypothetical protein MAPG_10129 [Magnaporthiopsis poae ATCC 64411]